MSNGHMCCIFGVCCPPGSQKQINALAAEMGKAGLSDSDLEGVAEWVVRTFDLAPHGSLQAFKDAIRDQAREGA